MHHPKPNIQLAMTDYRWEATLFTMVKMVAVAPKIMTEMAWGLPTNSQMSSIDCTRHKSKMLRWLKVWDRSRMSTTIREAPWMEALMQTAISSRSCGLLSPKWTLESRNFSPRWTTICMVQYRIHSRRKGTGPRISPLDERVQRRIAYHHQGVTMTWTCMKMKEMEQMTTKSQRISSMSHCRFPAQKRSSSRTKTRSKSSIRTRRSILTPFLTRYLTIREPTFQRRFTHLLLIRTLPYQTTLRFR